RAPAEDVAVVAKGARVLGAEREGDDVAVRGAERDVDGHVGGPVQAVAELAVAVRAPARPAPVFADDAGVRRAGREVEGAADVRDEHRRRIRGGEGAPGAPFASVAPAGDRSVGAEDAG